MSATRAALTDADIRALVRGPTADERASVAYRICRKIDSDLTDADRAAAEEVLRVMASDAAELVRRALAVTLKSSVNLPRDVALRLAKDVESVALPVLTGSPVFTDEDLADIVRACGAVKQVAVARRGVLSETVTGALARYAGEEAVQIAVANDNAAFSEAGLKAVIDRFQRSEAVTTAMAYRKVLPLSITERLVDLVSDAVRQALVDRHQITAETALHIAVATRERATLDIIDKAGRETDLQTFCAHLRKQDRLTASLLLRGLAHGHISFFEWGMAELAGLVHHRAWLMIHDAGPLGLKAIYERAGLQPRLYPAFRAGVDTYHALQAEGASINPARFQERMLARFLTQTRGAGKSDTDYLLEKLDAIAPPKRPLPQAARALV